MQSDDAPRSDVPPTAAQPAAPPDQITPERVEALNAAVQEAGVRFLGLVDKDLVFEVQRRSGSRDVSLDEVATTARELLRDATDKAVRDMLAEAAENGVRLKFY